MADELIKYKPVNMAKATWDYLVKFTNHHEGKVIHMYHNHPGGSKYPDVSCGIGFLLPQEKGMNTPSADTIKRWEQHFQNWDNTPPEPDQFRKEWERCYEIKRVSQPVNFIIKEFVAKTDSKFEIKLRLKPGVMMPKMAELLVSKLNTELTRSPLKDIDFWNLPATAQIAIASVSYGYSPTMMPNFGAALKEKNFERAAKEIQLSNMSPLKNYDHWLLMMDAAYLYENHRDDEAAMSYVPLSLSKWILLASQRGAVGLYGKSE